MYSDDTSQSSELAQAEVIIIQYLQVMNEYFPKRGLKHNPNKTEVRAFYLNNRQAYNQLTILSEETIQRPYR